MAPCFSLKPSKVKSRIIEVKSYIAKVTTATTRTTATTHTTNTTPITATKLTSATYNYMGSHFCAERHNMALVSQDISWGHT